MSISLRSIFPGAGVSLANSGASFGLNAPISVHTLAAHQGISAHYRSVGGPAGSLGAIMSPITPSGPSFVQNYRGGNLVFDDSGTVSLTDGLQLRITYEGIHCFGNPGGIANSDAYAIIQLLGVEQAIQKTTKVPEDGTDDMYSSLGAGASSTQGQLTWLGTAALAPIPPQTLTLSATVYHAGLLGADSQNTKNAMAGALGKAAQEFVGLFGLGIASDTAESVGEAVGNFIGSLLSLSDVKINTVERTFKSMSELTALPASDALSEGDITHNFATDLIGNGDASYKLYFNIEVLPVGAPVHS